MQMSSYWGSGTVVGKRISPPGAPFEFFVPPKLKVFQRAWSLDIARSLIYSTKWSWALPWSHAGFGPWRKLTNTISQESTPYGTPAQPFLPTGHCWPAAHPWLSSIHISCAIFHRTIHVHESPFIIILIISKGTSPSNAISKGGYLLY